MNYFIFILFIKYYDNWSVREEQAIKKKSKKTLKDKEFTSAESQLQIMGRWKSNNEDWFLDYFQDGV